MKKISHRQFKKLLSQDEIQLEEDLHIGKWYESYHKLSLVDFDSSYIDTFTGSLDGNGYTIYNLKTPICNVLEGEIKNVKITSEEEFTNSVIGRRNEELINNVTIECNIQVDEESDAGGFVSKNNGEILESEFSGKIIKPEKAYFGEASVGGIVGVNHETIKDCSVTDGYIKSKQNTGCIAGKNVGTVKNCIVENSEVCVEISNVGGVVGDNTGQIYDCHTINSTIKGQRDGDNKLIGPVGGIAGSTTEDSEIIKSSVRDKCHIEGGQFVGGIAGVNLGEILESILHKNNYITGRDCIGGIAGRTIQANNLDNHVVRIHKTIAEGEVSGEKSVGGVVGELNKYCSVSCSISNSEVDFHVSGGTMIGKVDKDVTIENCHYYGNQDTDTVGNGTVEQIYDSRDLNKTEVLGLTQVKE